MPRETVQPAIKRFTNYRLQCVFSCLLSSVFFLLASGFWLLASSYASDAETVLEVMQQRYAAVGTISGSFRLTYRAPGMEQVDSGLFWLKKPVLMRWEYRRPEEKLFIADGEKTYFYEPRDNHVTIQSFTAAELQSTPLQFLLGTKDIAGSYLIAPETGVKPIAEGTRLIRLTPRSEAEYSFLILEIDPASHDLRRLIIREQGGDTMEYLFTDLQLDVKVNKNQFRFEIPEGAEVFRMENDE